MTTLDGTPDTTRGTTLGTAPKQVPKMPIEITMFGEFSIRVGRVSVVETEEKADNLWHLLQLLITYRSAPLTNNEIIGKIWRHKLPSQPENALKNLVYRLRKMITDYGITNGKELILYTNKGYRWNNKFSCLIDCEIMEAHYTTGLTSRGDDEKAEHEFTEAIRQYRGYFLLERKNRSWTAPLRMYYHQMFLTAGLELVKIYEARNNYLYIEILCMSILRLDRHSEEMHSNIIRSLLKRDKYPQALAHYDYASNLYLQRGQESLPPSMISMYHELLDYVDEEEILALERRNFGDGLAFYCDYDTLKHLYLNETRVALRFYQNIFLVAFSVEFVGEVQPEREHSITRGMDVLHQVLQYMLSESDIYCRTTEARFLILMGVGNLPKAEELKEKVINRFRYLHRSPKIIITGDIQRLEPR